MVAASQQFEATVQVIDNATSGVLFAYNVKKGNFQSAAEAFAKHFKNQYLQMPTVHDCQIEETLRCERLRLYTLSASITVPSIVDAAHRRSISRKDEVDRCSFIPTRQHGLVPQPDVG